MNFELFSLKQESAAASAAKRAKLEAAIAVEEPEQPAMEVETVKPAELIELSESFINERLSVEITTELVMDSMVCKIHKSFVLFFKPEYIYLYE